MHEIKSSPTAQGETKVIVNANPDIIYEVVVQALDACRGKTDAEAGSRASGQDAWRPTRASATCSSRRA